MRREKKYSVTVQLTRNEKQKLTAFQKRHKIETPTQTLRELINSIDEINFKSELQKKKELINLVEGINDPYPYDTVDLIIKIREILN